MIRPTALTVFVLALTAVPIPLAAQTPASPPADSRMLVAPTSCVASLMIVETRLASIERTGWREDYWHAVDGEVATAVCDGVAIRGHDGRSTGTRQSGLEMAVTPKDADTAHVALDVTLTNPGGNHDRRVTIAIEVRDGDTVVHTGSLKTLVQDGAERTSQTTFDLPASLLIGQPLPILRLTLAIETTPSTAPPANPPLELTLGVNGPQHAFAEFPGLTLALAVLIPLNTKLGIGIVGDLDASYVRPARAAGVRFYARGESLASGKRPTVFVQVLAGSAKGLVSGIISATGGFLIQPGVGLSYGGRHTALHVEYDYRRVSGGRIYNSQTPGTSEPFPRYRIVIGLTLR